MMQLQYPYHPTSTTNFCIRKEERALVKQGLIDSPMTNIFQ